MNFTKKMELLKEARSFVSTYQLPSRIWF